MYIEYIYCTRKNFSYSPLYFNQLKGFCLTSALQTQSPRLSCSNGLITKDIINLDKLVKVDVCFPIVSRLTMRIVSNG